MFREGSGTLADLSDNADGDDELDDELDDEFDDELEEEEDWDPDHKLNL